MGVTCVFSHYYELTLPCPLQIAQEVSGIAVLCHGLHTNLYKSWLTRLVQFSKTNSVGIKVLILDLDETLQCIIRHSHSVDSRFAEFNLQLL